ncbi:50S ribosomal protein L4 [Patescibacteria group bacterium]|nr:50S ribosomal protein L4 [Patescibacteria group bacterium]
MSDAKISILDNKGKSVGEVNLPEALQAVVVKPSVVHQVVVAYQANRRADTAHTKNRSEVRGGGKKPWKQKGTGRARHGSIRSPLWVGGGVVFGPRKQRDHSQSLPTKLKSAAAVMTVKDYLSAGRVTVVKAWPQADKTKVFVEIIKALAVPRKKYLLLLSDKEKALRRGFNNIPGANIMSVRQFNSYDGIKLPHWLISEDALQELMTRVLKAVK